MSGRCDQCRKRLNGDGNRTATRVLCDDCYQQFMGMAAGFMASGTVEDAISAAGWYERLRNQTGSGRDQSQRRSAYRDGAT